jgi:sn-glycerol 3-phosphate transport system ATP-binding protein
MNLMPGKIAGPSVVETAGGKLAFDTATFSVDVGQAVQVGVRPEDLHYVPEQLTQGGLAFEGEFVEELGATRLFHGMSGQSPLVISVAASAAAEPTKGARLNVEANAVHLFDAASGKSLRR